MSSWPTSFDPPSGKTQKESITGGLSIAKYRVSSSSQLKEKVNSDGGPNSPSFDALLTIFF